MEAGLPNGVLNVVHGTNVSSISIFFLDCWVARIILTRCLIHLLMNPICASAIKENIALYCY